MKDCGGCVYFSKLRQISAGICEKHDARTTSDSGRGCKDHKRPKFERKQFLLNAELLE